MSKLAVIGNVNGAFSIHSEWDVPDSPSAQGAIVNYLGWCQALWNDAGTLDATIKIVDENLNVFSYEGVTYEMHIVHTVQPEPEPEPEG